MSTSDDRFGTGSAGGAAGDRGRMRAPASPVAAGVAVLALTGLVAIASRGAPIWSAVPAGTPDQAEVVRTAARAAAIALLVALVASLAVHRLTVARRPSGRPFGRTLIRALPFAAIAVSIFALVAVGRLATTGGGDGDRFATPQLDLPGVAPSGAVITDDREGLLAGEDRRGAADVGEGELAALLDLRFLLLVVAALATVAVAATWSSRRRPFVAPVVPDVDPPDVAAERDDSALREAITETIDAMLADPDPRTAIVGAYARLLEGLAASGVARYDHEAPIEHLRRALLVLRVRPEPLRDLIGLFEVARFSTHPLTSADREKALSALRTAAADLRSGRDSFGSASESR